MTNAELVSKIEELSENLQVDVTTEGLRKKELEELMEELQKKKTKDIEYQVTEGHALTSPRGILSPGDSVQLSDLNNNPDTLNRFLETGHIVKIEDNFEDVSQD